MRSAPTTIVASDGPCSASPSRMTSATVSPGRSAIADARASGREKIAPIDARTAFGPYGIRAAGADHDAAGAEGQRGAQHGADVARIAHAPERHAARSGRLGEALLEDADRPCPRPQRGRVREEPRLDLLTVEPAARRREQVHRPPAGRGGRPHEVLALGHEQPRPRPLAPRGELADLLELGVVGARDGHEKRAPSLRESAPVRCSVWRSRDQAADASRAASTNRRKVSGSRTAMSARTLRSSSMPASERPWMNVP